MPQIQTPDGQVFNFPDTMSRAQIAEALQRRLGNKTQPQVQPQQASPQYNSFSDLAKQRGQQFAQGATEAFASLPEAAAIAGAGNPNTGALVVSETVQKAQTDLSEAQKRRDELIAAYSEAGREPPPEQLSRIDGVINEYQKIIGNNQGYLDTVTNGGELNLKPDAQDRDLFKSGDALRQTSEDFFGKPQENDQSFWGQVSQGGGTVAGMLAQGPLGIAGGSAMNSSQLYKEAIDAGASEQDAKRAAELGAWVGTTEIIPINRALKLLPPRLRKQAGSKFWKKVSDIAQSSGEEAAQEYAQTVANNLIAQGIYDPDRGWNEGAAESALVGAVIGGGVGTLGVTLNSNLYTEDGKLNVNNLDNSTKLAAGDVARELQQIATAEGFNLKNVNISSQFGAKGALEEVRKQNNGEITELVKALKGKLNSKNAKSLDQVLTDYAPANAAIKQGKNKVSGYVNKADMAALARLVGPYQEGAALMNALAKSNVITGLFKDGMKGGVSQFTDYFNPLGTSGAVYDPTRLGNIVLGGGLAATTGFSSLPVQAGIVGLGRLVDAATGRRNKLARFVNKNVNAQGLPSPSGVSLVDKANKAAADSKVIKEALARIATQIDAPTSANSPVGSILSGTGLSRAGLSQIITRMPQDFAGQPELALVLESIQQNMDGDTNPVLELNEIIPILGKYAQMTAPELIVATPDNSLLARGVQQSPAQTQAQTAAPGQPQSGNQFTTPENYQAGKSDNNSFARTLASQVSEDAGVSVSDKAQLMTALEDVQSSLGPDPVAALDEITTELQNIGVNQDTIDTYFKPYRDRVALQQARVGRMQTPSDQSPAAPTVDQSSVAPTEEPQTYEAALERLTTTNIVAGAVRKITEGNMDPASVEAMLNQLEQNNPGIKAKILDITDPQQQAEDRPRFARIAPVPFNNDRMQQMFGVEDPTPGGNYIDLDTKEDLTGNTYAGGKVSIVDGKPVLDTSDDFSEPATKADGRKVKVNLFKQKAGWKWIDYDGPATIVSTEVGGKHHYALSSDFQNPVTLQTYPNQPSEPRLRPTTQGEVELGNKIGNISVRGKIHPVYDEVRIVSKSPERPQVSTDGPLLSSEQNPLGIPAADLQATNVDYTPTPDEIEAMRSGSYKPEKKRTLVEAAGWLHDKWTKATGRSTPFEYTPENIDRISSLMATEAMQALKNDGNAIGWYDRKLKAAKRVVSLVDPRVTQSPDAEAAFDYALAVTSNGQAVADNFVYALEVFRHFMDKGIMPTDTWIKGGERNIAMVEAFEFFNAYNASGQNMPIQEFLDSDFTVKELDAWAQQFNEKNGTNITVPASEGANELVKASFIVGPKIGQGFYQNIRGNYDPLTMDIWWMRMWNRLVGRPFESEKDLNKNRKRMREALKTKNQNDLEKRITKEALKLTGFTRSDLKDDKKLDEFVLKLDSRYQSFFTKTSKELKGTGKKVPKPETFQASGTMKRNLSPQLQATPKGPGERSYMRQVTKAAIQKLKENGFDITTADFQALMWYPEKQLFRKMGVAPGRGADNDYLDAAIMLAEQEGFTNDQINQALPSSDGDGAVGNQSDTEGLDGPSNNGTSGDSQSPESPRFNQQPTGVAGILAQRIQGSQDGSTARRPVPTTQEVKLEAPTVRAAIEIGKPGGAFENGIPQGLENAKRFAKAVDITLQLVEDNEAMLDAARITGEDRDAGKNASGVYNKYGAFVMKPGSKLPSSNRFISDFEAYVTAFHETMHGLSGTDLDGRDVPEALISKNYLTGEVDYAAPKTFDGLIGQLVNTPSVNSNNVIKDILKIQDEEVFTNGDNVQPVRISGPAKRILGVIPDMTERAEVQSEIDRFEKYSRSVSELAVDALTFYGMDPKRMKKEYPHAAKAVREFFKNSTKVQFYSHPLAMAFAVVMAMLMKQEQAEEEERQKQQQMAPGALTPPPGALSAA